MSHQLGNIVSHGRGRQFSSRIRVAVIKVCTEGVFEIEVRRRCVGSRIISPDQISGLRNARNLDKILGDWDIAICSSLCVSSAKSF